MGEALITRRGGSVELKQVAIMWGSSPSYSEVDYDNYDYLVIGRRNASDGSDPMQVVFSCDVMALVTGVDQISGTYKDETSNSPTYVSAGTDSIRISGYDNGPATITRVYPKGSLEIVVE